MNLDIAQILSILAGLFVIIGVGYGAVKLNILTASATPVLSMVLLRISLPCTIFVAMIRPYDPQFLTDGLIIMGLSAGFILLYIVIALAEVRIWKIPKGTAGSWLYCMVFSNAGFIGYPIALALFGDEGLSLAVILNVPLMLIAFSWGIYYIQKHSDDPTIPRPKIWRVLISDCNVVLALSMICYVNEWTPPSIILEPATYLAALTTPLSLLIVGISLAGAKTEHLLKDKQVITATVMRLLVFPGITCGVLLALNLDNPMIPALVMILFATPSPASAAGLCASNGGDEALAAKITFLTSLLCMVTIPLWSLLF